VKLQLTHAETEEQVSHQNPTDPDLVSGPFLIDTGVLLTLQVSPKDISESWINKLSKSRLLYSASSIGEIQHWLNGDSIIRDTIRRHDFIELLTQGIYEIPIDSNIISEAMTLRGEFTGDINDRILVATARLHQATIITKNSAILNYDFVNSIII
jgi:PIN domain nuclease of toxin-antitoxin system